LQKYTHGKNYFDLRRFELRRPLCSVPINDTNRDLGVFNISCISASSTQSEVCNKSGEPSSISAKKVRKNRTVSTSSSSNVSRIIDYIEQKNYKIKKCNMESVYSLPIHYQCVQDFIRDTKF